jgi:hypothetical protein
MIGKIDAWRWPQTTTMAHLTSIVKFHTNDTKNTKSTRASTLIEMVFCTIFGLDTSGLWTGKGVI